MGVVDSVGGINGEVVCSVSSGGNEKDLYAGLGVIGEESTNAQWVSRASKGVRVEAYQHKSYLSRLALVFRRPFLFVRPADESKRKEVRV